MMINLDKTNIAVLICGMGICPYILTAQKSDENPKNILLILIDDLKPNLGCYGDSTAKSPNIDKLAEEGILFNHAYCNQAVSVASRYNLLTGARSTSTGLYYFGTDLRDIYPDAVTLPQFFMNAGYHTEAIGKVFHVGHGNTEDAASWSIPHYKEKVIEYLLPESTNRQLTREEAYFENSRLYFSDLPPIKELPRGAAWEAPDVLDEAYGDGRVATHAISRLRELKKQIDKPFLMALGFARPHLPFCAPKRYWDLYNPEKLPMPEYVKDPLYAPKLATKRGGEIEQFNPIPQNKYVYNDTLTRKLIHGYYASMSYMDAQLGRVIDELKRLNMFDDTIIVLWGDHGWHLGDHGYWTKHTNYEQANIIPLIIVSPGITKPGTRSNQLTETVDIFPTLTKLTGLGTPQVTQPIDGISLVPVIEDPKKIIKDHVYHAFPSGNYLGRAIRTDRYRLIEWKSWDSNSEITYELYDYKDDPLETKNIAMFKPEILVDLKKILEKYPEAKRPARK